MNDVAFQRRPRRRRSPSIASARRTWERDVRPRGWARFVRAYPGQWSTSPALAAADLRRAIAIFDAHYLGTATVRVS